MSAFIGDTPIYKNANIIGLNLCTFIPLGRNTVNKQGFIRGMNREYFINYFPAEMNTKLLA